MEKKKESSLQRLMAYAGNYKYFTYASWLLSAVSAAFALVPFYYLWKIIKEVLDVMPNFENAVGIVKNGWLAVLFAALSMVIYIGGLMCSHTAAFRVQANLRKSMMHHIAALPMGEIEKIGSGKLRKTVNDCSASTETYLAHQLPDSVGSVITPMGLCCFYLFSIGVLGFFHLFPLLFRLLL